MRYLVFGVFSAVSVGVLVACASAAQGSRADYETLDEFYGFTPWQKLEIHDLKRVSIYDLIVNGEKYDDQFVQVQGFLRYEEENGSIMEASLYADTESLEYGAYENSIKLGEELPECVGRFHALDGEFLLLSGVYRHSGRMLSPIDHIRLIKLGEETREIEQDEIVCNDPSLLHLVTPAEE